MDIHVQQISNIYGEDPNLTIALKPTDMVICGGDFISVMRPSGSGKSRYYLPIPACLTPAASLLSAG